MVKRPRKPLLVTLSFFVLLIVAIGLAMTIRNKPADSTDSVDNKEENVTLLEADLGPDDSLSAEAIDYYKKLITSHTWGAEPDSPFLAAEHTILTKELLVNNNWGPESRDLGQWTEFYDDGTFDRWQHGAHEIGIYSGTYRIEGDVLILTYKRFNGEKWPEDQFPLLEPNTLTLHTSDDSLFFTQFLEEEGVRFANGRGYLYWNQASHVPDGSERIVDKRTVITVDESLMPETDATVYSGPNSGAGEVTFVTCQSGCHLYGTDIIEYDKVAPTREVVTHVLARTQSAVKLNGQEDYWYLVYLDAWWAGTPYIGGKPAGDDYIEYGWIHGSEMH